MKRSLFAGLLLVVGLFGSASVLAQKTAADYSGRGYTKMENGDLEGAMADYDHALKIDPEFAPAYHNRGFSKHQKGDFDGALADYNRALKIDPKFADTYYNRGYTKSCQGDLSGAMADYNRALEINPKDAEVYFFRGSAHFLSRNWTKALQDFRRAREFPEQKQDYAPLFIWLTRARLGETEAAKEELAGYVKKRWGEARGDWTSNVADFFLGKTTESGLFAAAKSPDAKKEQGQLCEAWFYAGMKKLIGGNKVEAATYFRKSLGTEQRTFNEYLAAGAELKALNP